MPDTGTVNVRCMVDDVEAAIASCSSELEWFRQAGVRFRNDIVTGPGGSQILLEDPAGNPVELFQPAGTRP